MSKIMRLKTEEFKYKCLNYLGGKKCYRCETEEWTIAAYDFDHKNEGTKEFEISKMITKPWCKVKNELDKCVILCANCHRDRHYLKEKLGF
jgi:hypothetical protein